MFRSILFFMICSTPSFAASPAEIHRMLDEIHYAVDHQNIAPQDMANVQSGIQNVLDFIYKRPVNTGLMCSKSDNGLFYPTRRNGEIVGDNSYKAGFSALADCKMTLPKAAGALTCFKRNNGLFYPTDPVTGEIIGATSYSAGYAALPDCLAAIQ